MITLSVTITTTTTPTTQAVQQQPPATPVVTQLQPSGTEVTHPTISYPPFPTRPSAVSMNDKTTFCTTWQRLTTTGAIPFCPPLTVTLTTTSVIFPLVMNAKHARSARSFCQTCAIVYSCLHKCTRSCVRGRCPCWRCLLMLCSI